MTALFWLLLNLFSTICLAFFSMTEMAFVSFNRVRLHYYVSKKNRLAIWINDLLKHPSHLFGTTLIGVNVSMVVGSECSREFHAALGLSPSWAPLSQVIFVVLFGELAPMFAARHYAEQTGMMGAPFIYFSAKILAPLLWVVEKISNSINWLLRAPQKKGRIYLTQEELQKVVGGFAEESPQEGETSDFDLVTTHIFQLRHQRAGDALRPLQLLPKLPSSATVADMRQLLREKLVDCIPIYHKKITNIIGIAYPRDLVRAPENQRIRHYARAPWFVTRGTHLTHILEQFKSNKQRLAVVLDAQGRALGLLTLEDLLEEIFGKATPKAEEARRQLIIDRTFPGSMTVSAFEKQYALPLYEDKTLSLSDLLSTLLGRHPEPGDTVYLPLFELTAKETTLLEVKNVEIKSRVI